MKPAPPLERERPMPRKKNTKTYCKGVVGRAHQPEMVYYKPYQDWFSLGDCLDFVSRIERNSNRPPAHCMHQEKCKNCGKVLSMFVEVQSCPDLARNRVSDSVSG